MSVSEVLYPTPRRPLKRRFLEHLTPQLEKPELREPAPKRRREESPVFTWLNDVPPPRPQSVPAPTPPSRAQTEFSRSQSVPPKFDKIQDPLTRGDFRRPKSPLTTNEMGDRRDRRDDDRSRRDNDSFSQYTSKTSTTKTETSSPRYRDVLGYNGIEMDPMGYKIPQDIRSLVNTHILKPRTSPPLSEEQLKTTMESMYKWGNSTENVVNNVMTSHMFPLHHEPGIGLGGNSQWAMTALPYNADYAHPLSTPKADYHVGYATGPESGFSAKQARVIEHPYASPYTQPATGNYLPFFIIELKSEATGGTLYHAENQAAGSGTYSLRAMEWLLEKAKTSEVNMLTDTVSFTMAGSARMFVLSVHWKSLEDRKYMMSYVKSFVISESQQVQACHSTVKNIIEWGLGLRRTKVGEVLEELFPFVDQWSKRTSTAAELDNPGYEDEGEEQGETIEVRSNRLTKTSRRSSRATKSFASTQSAGGRRSATTRDTSLTKRSKRDSKQGS